MVPDQLSQGLDATFSHRHPLSGDGGICYQVVPCEKNTATQSSNCHPANLAGPAVVADTKASCGERP